ncbi:hypothetical protein RND71_026587 [Anisodus tanguticus]|uniref:Uncharacterized protein n=1 Tax=Anisodus tanguticus TaxID=243964 RepID=A0AAE1RP65_9SOLA|nr:hypothetical protein RND71_026587 [Anisodus tanguticus]
MISNSAFLLVEERIGGNFPPNLVLPHRILGSARVFIEVYKYRLIFFILRGPKLDIDIHIILEF